jgi:protein gp37
MMPTTSRGSDSMAANTKIQWTDFTFNPWIGCTKVSPGCKNCYAVMTTRARVLRSQGHETWGKGAKRARTSEGNWKLPLRWSNQAKRYPDQCTQCGARLCMAAQIGIGNTACPSQRNENGEFDPSVPKCGGDVALNVRRRVFCASTADWLDDEVPAEWLADLLQLIHATPNLDWQLLTKRPENWSSRIEAALDVLTRLTNIDHDLCRFLEGWLDGEVPKNIWIGASAENQECFDLRYMALGEIPTHTRFWSMEPLLGSIDFTAVQYISSFKQYFHWVIVGGESGRAARECHTDDIRDIVSQCELAGVACFVKQLGSTARAAGSDQPFLIAMEDKKGGDIAEWPQALQVRQFPEAKEA